MTNACFLDNMRICNLDICISIFPILKKVSNPVCCGKNFGLVKENLYF